MTISICPYCGCGCKLDYVCENGKITAVKPVQSDEVSEGKPCIKGLSVHEVANEKRILHPMIRVKGKLVKASWQEAFKFIREKTKDLAPEEIMFNASGKIPNEDNYIIQKFARICYNTNNVDSCCSRLCHAATVKAMQDCYGTSNMTRMESLDKIDCLFIIGSNPANNYPVFFNKIMAQKHNFKMVSIQTWKNETSRVSDIAAEIMPGTELVIINGIVNSLLSSKKYDKHIETIEGFARLKKAVSNCSEEYACKTCGISKETFKAICKAVIESKSLGIFHGMGFTQHVNSIENVHSLLNLLMIKIGLILTLRGEVNVQGVGDMGCFPFSLPNGSFQEIGKLETFWDVKLPNDHGKTIMEALLLSPVKAAFITGFNPARSMPNLTEVHKVLEKLFLVCMASYMDATTDFASVVLPVPIMPEREGTIANGERRIRHVTKVVEPPGQAMPEWKIFKDFSSSFGKENYFDYESEKEIFLEIINIVPDYGTLNADWVYKGNDEWPDKTPKFKMFWPETFEGVDELTSAKYPMMLTTHRSKFQFLTSEMTSKSKTLSNMDKKQGFFMNSKEAKRLGLKEGGPVKVTSCVGSLTAKLSFDENVPDGRISAMFHFEDLPINKLFPTQFDEETFTPNYKAVAVKIEAVKEKVKVDKKKIKTMKAKKKKK